jgi:predicted Fe-Mo cluster-binding NifX family protein
MGETIAPCLEYSATIAVFTVEDGVIVDQIDFPIRSREPLDRLRLLRDQCVDTIICGGVQDVYEDLVRASGIRLISWVSGNIEDLLNLFLRGQLVPGDRAGGGRGKRKGRMN